MLFTNDVNSIEYSDVESFLKLKLRENTMIDYKMDSPADLAKYIAAFANAAGGIILIGIRAKQTTNEPQDSVGVDFRQGLEELASY